MSGIYCGPAPFPAEIWSRWNLDPVLLAALALLALCLARSGAGRTAVLVLLVAFVSPLCALSSALFAARVVHHVLLVAVAAPLLARALPARRAGGTLPGAFVLSTAVLWAWHLPAAYDLALSNHAAYWLMQITLIASATWFWRAVFAPGRAVVDSLVAVVAGFTQMGMLGAILTFAPRPLYSAHFAAPFEWGLTPLADQQLGGLLMWVPAGVPYAAAAATVARRGWQQLRERPA